MESLEGKAALVTGGSRGIGAAIAARLARAGARVALTYRSSAERAEAVVERIRADGGTAIALQAEMADVHDVRAAVTRAAGEFNGLDVLVNNAGSFPYGTIEELTVADYEHAMNVHARAAFVAVQAALPHLRDGGRIISIGSSLVERATTPGLTVYAMSKSALVGFTRGLARDLGPRNITAVVVHPGSTDTEMNPADEAEADAERARTALGRYAAAAEIAETVAHLAGVGGAYITGTAITVDGGAAA